MALLGSQVYSLASHCGQGNEDIPTGQKRLYAHCWVGAYDGSSTRTAWSGGQVLPRKQKERNGNTAQANKSFGDHCPVHKQWVDKKWKQLGVVPQGPSLLAGENVMFR